MRYASRARKKAKTISSPQGSVRTVLHSFECPLLGQAAHQALRDQTARLKQHSGSQSPIAPPPFAWPSRRNARVFPGFFRFGRAETEPDQKIPTLTSRGVQALTRLSGVGLGAGRLRRGAGLISPLFDYVDAILCQEKGHEEAAKAAAPRETKAREW